MQVVLIYMTKSLRKAIMRRSELKSKYFKNQIAHDFELYKKNRKIAVANCINKKAGDNTLVSI